MAIKKNIGGDRLGSGAKMTVDLKTYNRSTHDRGYIWRSTMSAGTLVPFMKQVVLPGSTFDINLDIDVKTHPTIGPLFGSYKVQLDLFQCPFRLYHSALHNNALGIGMDMSKIKLPLIKVPDAYVETANAKTLTNKQIEAISFDPSSLLAHLDIQGGTVNVQPATEIGRHFNAIPYLAYWDIYKNYYANKQEEVGMMIDANTITSPVISADVLYDNSGTPTTDDIPAAPAEEPTDINTNLIYRFDIVIDMDQVGTITEEIINKLRVGIDLGGVSPFMFELRTLFNKIEVLNDNTISCSDIRPTAGTSNIRNYDYVHDPDTYALQITSFDLEHIDDMREAILASGKFATFVIDDSADAPYGPNLEVFDNSETAKSQFSQQGLALKTYQSDLFNNWMSTEWVDNATTGINAITAVDTTGDSFTIDALNLAQKVYYMLNRIAISGGTYQDWLETVYTHDYINRSETPIYQGGLSRELVFQEVVSNSETGDQPLGTLAGKGVMGSRKKGGHVVIKVDEPSYIIGIVSLTPRIDYSQGNAWDTDLKTMDDLHKPALDEIGFQDLVTEQMAWWTTQYDSSSTAFVKKSAGKQPAWINYMTEVNKVRGNFAKADNQMFMTLNRRYEIEPISTGANPEDVTYGIKDLTTYVDPSKFNFIFADTDLTSQNFWVQIAADITARMKMSAKIMPNL